MYLYMLICASVKMCVHMGTCVCLRSGVDVGLWREGGSATALTDFQAPRHNRKPPLPPPPLLLTPAEADARFNTASTKQTQTPTVLLYVACSGCARRLVENPCLYRNHNTVDLQREAPAHARTTQNITDHLLNTEIEPHCNVKVWGYGGLAQPGKILFILLIA